MPAYIIFMREKTLDQSELENYWSKTPETLAGRPMRVLAAYGRHVTLEGPDVEGVVVAVFPSLEEARPGTTVLRIRKPLSTDFVELSTRG